MKNSIPLHKSVVYLISTLKIMNGVCVHLCPSKFLFYIWVFSGLTSVQLKIITREEVCATSFSLMPFWNINCTKL